MRTTLAIDDDVFSAVKGLANVQRQSVGTILSSLARQALAASQPPLRVRNGVPLLGPGMAQARRLRQSW